MNAALNFPPQGERVPEGRVRGTLDGASHGQGAPHPPAGTFSPREKESGLV